MIDQEEDGSPKAVAYWFTYGDDMGSAWYMAIGHVDGNQVLMELYSSGGVDFMQDASEDLNPVDAVGTLNLAFTNCNKGIAMYDTGESAGEFEIKRLASLYNSRCSGGISDNTPGNAKPLMLQVTLLPPGEGMEGKGKAKFWERSDRSDFHVSAEGLADGDYEIHVCPGDTGNSVGPLSIVEGEGATPFRSPESEGKLLLNFDPRDCPIEIRQEGAVFLTSGDRVLGGKQKGDADDSSSDDSSSDDDSSSGDRMKIEVELENTGLIEDAEGEIEYDVKKNSTELEVEIEDVPAGLYGFFVAGAHKGDIEVMDGAEKGKLRFSDPEKMGRLPLDFEPWDQFMEVRDGNDQPILNVTFPGAP